MKNVTTSRLGGFTLIELLVVVLIIGILAAIAVPQYQKAVEKSRAAAIPPLLRPLAAAKKAYYMANGTHARRFDDLDVALPADCRIYDNDWYGQSAVCGKLGIFLDAKYSNQISGRLFLSDGSDLNLYYPVLPTGPQEQCLACPATRRAKALCEGIGFSASAGREVTDGTGTACYQYNR